MTVYRGSDVDKHRKYAKADIVAHFLLSSSVVVHRGRYINYTSRFAVILSSQTIKDMQPSGHSHTA